MAGMQQDRSTRRTEAVTPDAVCRLLNEWIEHPKAIETRVLEYSRATIEHLAVLCQPNATPDYGRVAVAAETIRRALEYPAEMRPDGEPFDMSDYLDWFDDCIGNLLLNDTDMAQQTFARGLAAICEAYEEFKTVAR